jgi:hypothetical protein
MKNNPHRLTDIPIEIYRSHCRSEFWWGFLCGFIFMAIGAALGDWLANLFLR